MEDCHPTDTPVEYGTKLTKEGEGTYINPTYYIIWSWFNK